MDGGPALTLNAGAGGNETITGAAGGATPLTSLTVTSGAQVDLASVTTTGAQSITGIGIDLNGTVYTSNTAGAIGFTGPVDLDAGSIAITTAGAAGDDIS